MKIYEVKLVPISASPVIQEMWVQTRYLTAKSLKDAQNIANKAANSIDDYYIGPIIEAPSKEQP